MWLRVLLCLFCLLKPLTTLAAIDTKTTSSVPSDNFSIELNKLKPFFISIEDFANLTSLNEKKYRIATVEKLFLLFLTQEKIQLLLGTSPEDKEALPEIFKKSDSTLEYISEVKLAEIAYADYLIENHDFVDKLVNKKFSANAIKEPGFQSKKQEFLLKTQNFADILLKSSTNIKGALE